MISFHQEEIFTATEVVRNFSTILEKVSKNKNGKLVILKNNKFQAVMLSMDEYERLVNAVNLLENIYKNQKN
ncbi:type II toxin-antitoxin system Phd/YefM family antitoxin [Campylobacter sp. MIT 97-5078]|uniref:type II toxin-antitoxin system Phd/YefM family antitoxin n=1 Tax=Campylobacter sp. MIT 97-5078 TaxID=1548153 RepID=UPI000514081E|nr:type II toxin-antitoxin system Phd/YefM family antitoxin [Campylobacter sp. MIT 97-5078]KGI55603.1 prevent-host-death protein [Campylobacter sp. MIT 97-5078]KGI57267.1 prevent-host-death protein [Campylobacter sp. MIT 97-5078]TQR23567.1 type II toxin-antitoxin system Phd/YefM family antitoxin [Campylobacter sp. MIT 97-5078]